MKKFFILASLISSIFFKAYAVTLEGGVTYTVESARKITFKNAQKTIPFESFQSHLEDQNYRENKDMLKYGLNPKDRDIILFSSLWGLKLAYCVTYHDNPKYTYYYTKFGGQLIHIDVEQHNDKNSEYPILIYRYNVKGKLTAAGLIVSDEEGFLYSKNGKLLIHKLGDFGYNEKGKKVWKSRDIVF